MEYMIILGVAVVSVVAGFAAGYMLGGMRDEAKENQAESEAGAYPDDAIHIWNDSNSEQLILQTGQRTLRSSEPVSASEQKYLMHLINHLQKWIGTPSVPPQAAPTPVQPVRQPVAQAPPPSQDSVTPFVEDPTDTPAYQKSIVEQIDDILQDKLLNSALRERGIKLMQTLDGGMTIYVGLDQYNEIDLIPDEEVVKIIRAAVQEWEQRQ